MTTRFEEIQSFHVQHSHLHDGTWASERFHQRASELLEAMRTSLVAVAAGTLSAEQAAAEAQKALDLITATV